MDTLDSMPELYRKTAVISSFYRGLWLLAEVEMGKREETSYRPYRRSDEVDWEKKTLSSQNIHFRSGIDGI